MNSLTSQEHDSAKTSPDARRLRVAFFAYPTAFQAPGGGEIQLLKTKEFLESQGVEVKLFDQWTDRLGEFDIFHTFGSVKDCLEIIRTADLLGVRTVLSTICWYSWKSAWGIYSSWDQRALSLARQAGKYFCPFMPSLRKRMMECSDLVFPNSQTEADQLTRYFCVPKDKIHVVPNGVDPSFAQAKPDAFVQKFGLKDFILCVGRIEPRKNQLNMIRALREVPLPLVFVGDYVHQYRDYYQACRREAGDNVHFLGSLGHGGDLLASAYAACNTFLLASWLETPGLAALEAGLAGAKVVITDQGATQEYFQNFATYVAPDNLEQIRERTLETFQQSPSPELKAHIQQNYLWEHTARKTLEGYRRLSEFNSSLRSWKSRSRAGTNLRIGIDLQSLKGRKTGLGVYTENLVRTYFEQPVPDINFFFYSREKDEDLNTAQRWLWENMELPVLSRRDRVNILHVPAFAPPFIKSAKLVVTVHDLIGMLFPNQLRWPSAFYWGKWLPFALRRADAIIADSENTRQDLMTGLGIAEEKIHVVYLSGHEGFTSQIAPAQVEQVRTKYGIREKYFLFVGTIEPRKNLDRTIEAFASFLKAKKHDARCQLVVVGSKEFGHGKFFQSLSAKFGVTLDDVIFTGYASHEELNALYCGAEIFIYPSLYEGFGIPILEAMASGTPVLTSTKTSVPEVAGDAAVLVDPYNVQAICEGMLNMSGNEALRRDLVQKGFERIQQFSWKETSRKTIEVYRSLL